MNNSSSGIVSILDGFEGKEISKLENRLIQMEM
jgi:hypothetical protein